MKTKQFLISVLTAASALFAGSANAQISLGGNLSYLKFMGDEMKTSHPGLGIRGWYATSDRTTISLSANYFFGSSVKSSFSVLDSAGNPANADIETSTSVLQFDLRGNYYFVGDPEEDFNFYGTVGLGIVMASYSVDYSDNVPASMTEGADPESDGGFMLDLGLGVEKKFDFGYLFFEPGLSFPPFTSNSQDGVTTETNLASFFQLNAGIRIPLD